MKQKVVIKVVGINKNPKLRSKALKITVGCSGVEGAGIKGEEKDQIEITGEGMDAAELTKLLRKSVGHAELLTVGPMGEDKKKEEAAKTPEPVVCHYQGEGVPYYPVHHSTPPYRPHDPDYCSIM